ncbi:hypothetical protein D9M70_601930 [compost metagenome]
MRRELRSSSWAPSNSSSRVSCRLSVAFDTPDRLSALVRLPLFITSTKASTSARSMRPALMKATAVRAVVAGMKRSVLAWGFHRCGGHATVGGTADKGKADAMPVCGALFRRPHDQDP